MVDRGCGGRQSIGRRRASCQSSPPLRRACRGAPASIRMVPRIAVWFKLGFLAGGLVIAVGCATTAKFEQALSSWEGRHVNDLVDDLGYPTRTMDAFSGNTVYIYERRGSFRTAETTTEIYGGTTMTSGGQDVQLRCDAFFEIRDDGIIVRTSYSGNYCVKR